MPEQTKSGPVDHTASHLVANMDCSIGTCGETSLRQLHDGNAAIEEKFIMPNINKSSFHKMLYLSLRITIWNGLSAC